MDMCQDNILEKMFCFGKMSDILSDTTIEWRFL